MYAAISIKWKIKGVTIDQVTDSNVIIDGVVSFNTKQIKKAENILPGLSLYLNTIINPDCFPKCVFRVIYWNRHLSEEKIIIYYVY